jgi:hypothetical protein
VTVPENIPPASGIQWSSRSISFGSTRTAILDTDYLLNQVKEGVRRGGSLFLVGGPPLGKVRAFASSHVLQELYQSDNLGNRHKWDKLAKQSEVEGWPRTCKSFQSFFESQFLSHITFVDVSGMFEDDPSVEFVRNIDPKDAPTAQLAILLSRLLPIVYAHDKSLWRPGLAPHPMHFQAVLAAGRDLESSESATKGISYVGAGIAWGVNGATNKAAALLKVPRWVPYLVLAGGLLWYFIGEERRDKAVKIIKPVGDFLVEQAKLASDSIEILTRAVANVPADERLECRIAELLAELVDDEHLLAKDIQERFSERWPSISTPTIPTIRAVLVNPCFVEGPRYRFTLGQNYDAEID